MQAYLSEACDDGNTSNNDACLSSCTIATCGDGNIRVGAEECDLGSAMNGQDGVYCTSLCGLPIITGTPGDPGTIGPPPPPGGSAGIEYCCIPGQPTGYHLGKQNAADVCMDNVATAMNVCGASSSTVWCYQKIECQFTGSYNVFPADINALPSKEECSVLYFNKTTAVAKGRYLCSLGI